MSAPVVPELIEHLLEAHGLVVRRVLRDGPRYWVGRVLRGDSELILKAVIHDEPWQSPRTRTTFRPSDQLRAEILALRRFASLGERLPITVPRLVKSSVEGDTWSLREIVPGADMSATTGSLVFTPRFYSDVPPEAVINYILGYQGLTAELADIAQASPQTDQTDLRSKIIMADLGNPQGEFKEFSRAVVEYLRARTQQHDAAVDTLAHGECYPPHMFYDGGRMCFIDWENISLNNPLSDFMAVWLRAYDNPQWQAEFKDILHQRGVLSTDGRLELWDIETVYQSARNLNYLYWSQIETPQQKRVAADSLRRNLQNVL